MSRAIPKALQLRIFHRDGWHCRFCGRAIFFSPTLKLLDGLSPGHGYYDRHGKRGVMLAVLEDSCACCDHVEPYSRGGLTAEENLVAACFACNREKSDSAAPAYYDGTRDQRPGAWDGFASLYPSLPGASAEWCRAIQRELGDCRSPG